MKILEATHKRCVPSDDTDLHTEFENLKQELSTLQAKHQNVISISNEKINRANHTIKAKNEEIKNLTQRLASNNLDISER